MRDDAIDDVIHRRIRRVLRLDAVMLAQKRLQLVRRLPLERLLDFPRASSMAHAFPLHAKFQRRRHRSISVFHRATVHYFFHHVPIDLVVVFTARVRVVVLARARHQFVVVVRVHLLERAARRARRRPSRSSSDVLRDVIAIERR